MQFTFSRATVTELHLHLQAAMYNVFTLLLLLAVRCCCGGIVGIMQLAVRWNTILGEKEKVVAKMVLLIRMKSKDPQKTSASQRDGRRGGIALINNYKTLYWQSIYQLFGKMFQCSNVCLCICILFMFLYVCVCIVLLSATELSYQTAGRRYIKFLYCIVLYKSTQQ